MQPGTSLGEVCELITTQGARVFVRCALLLGHLCGPASSSMLTKHNCTLWLRVTRQLNLDDCRGYWGRSLVLCFECFYFRDHWVVRQLQVSPC